MTDAEFDTIIVYFQPPEPDEEFNIVLVGPIIS